ncbi:hypothetical protein TNCV_932521 [Trichonephila clavipes]|nr:hypothetical protein TNCV_932521 [Trichonephila clavipes]
MEDAGSVILKKKRATLPKADRHVDAVIETEQRTDPVPHGCYRTHASVLINGVPSSRKNSILSAKAPRERVRMGKKCINRANRAPSSDKEL